jgi:YggT family protein
MTILRDLLGLYIVILVLAAVFSWVRPPHPSHGFHVIDRFLYHATEPVLRPLRRIMPRASVGGMGIDFSVTIAIVLCVLLLRIL